MAAKTAPFRTADRFTSSPDCGHNLGWNTDDGLKGQTCPCGRLFTGNERNRYPRDLQARRKSRMRARLNLSASELRQPL